MKSGAGAGAGRVKFYGSAYYTFLQEKSFLLLSQSLDGATPPSKTFSRALAEATEGTGARAFPNRWINLLSEHFSLTMMLDKVNCKNYASPG